jgi:hypothetical protein
VSQTLCVGSQKERKGGNAGAGKRGMQREKVREGEARNDTMGMGKVGAEVKRGK